MHRGDAPAYELRGRYATELFTEEAVQTILSHNSMSPLYLQLSHLGVHAPLEVPLTNHHDEDFAHIQDENRRKYASKRSWRGRVADASNESVQENECFSRNGSGTGRFPWSRCYRSWRERHVEEHNNTLSHGQRCPDHRTIPQLGLEFSTQRRKCKVRLQKYISILVAA